MVKVHDKDRYRRIVAEIILPDGRNLNHEIVRAGLAWQYKRYSPHDRELWSDPKPIPPWEWW